MDEIIKIRRVNGATLIALPKRLAATLPTDVRYALVFADGDEFVIRPLTREDL